jgi:hypothetical protein
MKKLLGLFLVLGFVSLANAVINSPMWIVPFTDGTVGIELLSGMSSAVDNYGGYWALIGVDPASGIIAPPPPLDMSYLFGSSTQFGLPEGVIGGFVASSTSSWTAASGIYAYNFTPIAGSGIYLYRLDDGFGSATLVDVLTLDREPRPPITPEPATIALLCLGGLMLRRKK